MPSDRSLLDRLNALRPTTVSFEKSSNTTTTPTPLYDDGKFQPVVSREDALAARLRSLRNQPDNNGQPGAELRAQPLSAPKEEPEQQEGSDKRHTTPPNRNPNEKEVDIALPSVPGLSGDKHLQGDPNWWEVLEGDEFVEAYIAHAGTLGCEKPDLDWDGSLEPVDLPPDPKHEAQKLTELVQSLKQSEQAATARGEGHSDDDNSDGEEISRAVETILSQARDEISLLPDIKDNDTQNDGEARATNETNNDDDDGSSPLISLPSVPSQPPKDPVDDLAARLRNLRGIGPVDSFGLPAAPTFKPESRPSTTQPSSSSQSILQKNSRNKYSDSDQSTWCVVCLEDGTVKCEGCDGDVYCFRCWKEMHVGVRAGYEERGHRWVKFETGGPVGGPGGGGGGGASPGW